MKSVIGLLSILTVAGCGMGAPGAADFVDSDLAVTPGLASCATAIGRPDLAADPQADMSPAEIEALIACTAERAQG